MRMTFIAVSLILAQALVQSCVPATRRVMERIGRAPIARRIDGGVYVGWRMLAGDPADIVFNVHRVAGGGEPVLLTPEPLGKTTDFVDLKAPRDKKLIYTIRPVINGRERKPESTPALDPDTKPSDYISLKLQGDHTIQKVGIADLDGDGRYDYVIKQPADNIDPWIKVWKRSPDTYKLEAYSSDGTFLWRYDMGWAIERGIWYSPYVVYDLDGDGRAEVAVKAGKGDPRDAEGRVRSGPEYLAILDGLTGRVRETLDWPSRKPFSDPRKGYNHASRNQLGIAYLDGKTPSLIVERGTYNLIVVIAYEFHGGRLRKLWEWNNKGLDWRYRGEGAHWMHAADVDGDTRDEVIIGSVVLDDNGKVLWTTGLGHPDHVYVADIDPSRPGLEIYYGLEKQRKDRNGMCLVDGATGRIIWGHEEPTRHVHSLGMCGDIDANYPGAECYSADMVERGKPRLARLRSAKGEVLDDRILWGFGTHTVYWDADPQRELFRGRGIMNYGADDPLAKVSGRMVVVADILGDWREEIITSVRGEMRIYTTTIPATDRRPCLMTDPIYRIDVAHAAMGYMQVPMLSYDMASRAETGK